MKGSSRRRLLQAFPAGRLGLRDKEVRKEDEKASGYEREHRQSVATGGGGRAAAVSGGRGGALLTGCTALAGDACPRSESRAPRPSWAPTSLGWRDKDAQGVSAMHRQSGIGARSESILRTCPKMYLECSYEKRAGPVCQRAGL